MPDWLKDWGTFAIAAFGAITGGSSLLINWLNRRDVRRKEVAEREAKRPWAELAFERGPLHTILHVGVHNPSGRNFELSQVVLVEPPGWAIVHEVRAPADLNDDFVSSPVRTLALTGFIVEVHWQVGSPPAGTTLASRLRLDMMPASVTDGTPSASAEAKPITVEIRLTGTWISANADRIVLTARTTMTP